MSKVNFCEVRGNKFRCESRSWDSAIAWNDRRSCCSYFRRGKKKRKGRRDCKYYDRQRELCTSASANADAKVKQKEREIEDKLELI